MRRFVFFPMAAICVFTIAGLVPARAGGPYHVRMLNPPGSPSAGKAAATQPAARIEGHPIGDRLSSVYERTANRFKKGLFYKPNRRGMSEEDRQFGVLLVQEAADNARKVPRSLQIGTVVTDASGRTSVDTSRPVVYATRSHIALGDMVCEQRVHIWAYPGQDGEDIIWRGVRTTYGPTGYPLAWEMLNIEGEPVVLFVCSTIEKAAEREFGQALPGRKASVERSLEDQPDVAVARILPPGAQPAGPVVYLDAPDKTPTTALCRCMPAQVDDFVENEYYELLPLEILDGVQIASDGPFRLVKGSITDPPADPDQPWLTRVLRMPRRF